MKKLLIIALMFTGTVTFAQGKLPAQHEKLSTEQKTELHVKKMTLDLDLTEAQQKDIRALMAEENNKRDKERTAMQAKIQKGDKLTANDRYERQSLRLDGQIALKEKFKKILSAEQFEKWESKQDKRNAKTREFVEKRKESKATEVKK